MKKPNPKIIVIIDMKGVRSVAVHADDDQSRSAGYDMLKVIEPALTNVDDAIRAIYGTNTTKNKEVF